MSEGAKSGTSLPQKGRALEKSRKGVVQKTNADILPSYGAQHRQDALWEGGNEALPPGWQEFDVGNHDMQYQDNNLAMVSLKRPLQPGIDSPGQLLVPGCEWHISPLGRSYFVNHNNRTTSWKKPMRERPPGSLTPTYIIKGHSKPIRSIACVGNSRSIISSSDDGSIRQWTRDGKAIGQPWRSDGVPVISLVVSPDETMVVSGSWDGRIRLWDIKDGRIIGEPWEGHSDHIRCMDWSPNGQEIVSGSDDFTIRRWNPNGRQMGPPIVGQNWWMTVKYSPQGDKFAACGLDGIIHVWSKNGKLLVEISNGGYWVHSLCWATDGTCIFSGSEDSTIRKWRLVHGEELFVLRGHTDIVRSLCLTFDEYYLVSASLDSSVRIWDLRTNKPVGGPLWHDDQVLTLAIHPDRQCIASSGLDMKIYLWDFDAVLKQSSSQDQSVHHDNNLRSNVTESISSSRDILDVPIKSQPRLNNPSSSKYGDNFWGSDQHHSTSGPAPLSSPSTSRRNLFDFLRFSSQPVHSSAQTTQQRRRWNFGLSLGRISTRTARIAAARDDDRYYVTPPTAAEIAKAMEHEPGTTVNDSVHQDEYPPVQGPQEGASGQISQAPNEVEDGDERSCVIGCCGMYLIFGGRKPQ